MAVRKRWLPQLEVEVEPSQRIDKNKFLLTDVDVLAVASSPLGTHSKFVFDCKSGARESAISRAFWLHGVIARTRSTRGFVILNDRVGISRDHRISASDLGVTLLHESEVETFAAGLDASVAPIDSTAASIEAWEEFLAVKGKYPGLEEYFEFSRSTYWMEKRPGDQCRKLVAKVRRIRSEIDPAKREHLAVFGDALCLFLHAVSEMAIDLFLLLLRPASREEYTDALLAVLYGGHDNLEAAQKIRRAALGAEDDDAVSLFPDLPRFEHLIREVVQAPLQALPAALMARELAFRNLLGAPESATSREIAAEHPYVSKFIFLSVSYLTKALRLPPEFAELYNSQMAEIEAAARSAAAAVR
ncbi:MAG: hypothetical protein DI603_09005 [Roseateles depolymerans]|uniref:Uncharacterized protein n=1 Tax=Roseateles depolymerans TaxID=76731 RepID=A0A2W5DPX1_9BURK|nr:MAG: hypothetical protein DI603_09005 [Roseateles depolymerans]